MNASDLFKPFRPVAPIVVEPQPLTHLVCGVPDCGDGYIERQDDAETVIACDTHNARTTHNTHPREEREQRIVRVQDNWRQHGTAGRDR